ncbi:MAG: hypothetical protein A3C80_02785 [Candidatus Ryanbacteria bacterium RIFCSPHIGHO2_02_FULL_45_43]|uniref:Uncharacterized protein n=1 Tax=Candidatus Ryanbacteria bacterium RIFCSPHIGHO2_01_45_13 TaxID=1802112 RepID=A0A1G2FZL8_9BACT|nr:MAG: hypothetical protein A2718_01200 [Candidatus Ryanbacteria bacterium RIFCSPHIGHO2_01_FULL_44_130]OGZ43523.1 MAG: hypothetical protein A2W41_04275 [Candidatus Ryanbacteria bacterium RIFCSPHIGHO2_01_45_13]OGZ47867.1 MAG: hypothetical protein A3C80_02785 [Candidatus Ryanbacteria bacterium RIFCSPHIGHO2_02_FULL_45_43]OGZ49912.1 MAG: hypothetical protein A3E55_03820 [Candidatus Ryanbacteria bacterium RIFCSPHIGHO2_12_FULL_44_20]OGZ51022.1 MAG: hypothetical protein A3A17_03360 [Candidatus Ryanba
MISEIKNCQNCKKEFTIESEDLVFYEKIKVPPPTWCPECRFHRRLATINERTLFKRKDSFDGKEIVSIFSPDVPFPVFREEIWRSEKWDPQEYERTYNFSTPFFKQLKELFDVVPRQNLNTLNSINCHYCSLINSSKNCYRTVGFMAEDCLYGHYTRNVKNSADYFYLIDSENCYETIDCAHCYNVTHSQYAAECYNSSFLYDCVNCHHCFGCIGLRNKSYHIFNKPYQEEEYKKKISQYNLGNQETVKKLRKEFEELKKTFPRRYAHLFNSVNTTGNNVTNAKNCTFCFDIDPLTSSTENCKNVLIATAVKDSYDLVETGEESQLCYEVDTAWGYRVLFSQNIIQGHNVQYSYNCRDCSDIFGCNGLRNKQYCVLNKQYTKEEYEKLIPKIIEHMNEMPYVDKKKRIYKYGEFFPTEFSPFAYNETMAQEYLPFTKEEILEWGYSWKNPEAKEHNVTIQPQNLPNHIKDITDDILNQIIGCEHKGKCNENCSVAFRIIPQELEFYRKQNLSFPRLCPNCRHYQRIKQRNPLKLWHRKCTCSGTKSDNGIYQNTAEHFHKPGRCPNEFETSYALERLETVYCEQCYSVEVA